jgi:hypothetical protein
VMAGKLTSRPVAEAHGKEFTEAKELVATG